MVFLEVYILKMFKIKKVQIGLKNRIISLGLKPISAIVDATNYVMFDLNRPLHAYDADKIDQEIIVRNSKKGESFEALDNKKYTLQNSMCAITDKSGVFRSRRHHWRYKIWNRIFNKKYFIGISLFLSFIN